jgi:parallel beta-helix repeat protein
VDGATQESNRGDQRSGRPDIVLDGVNLGTGDSGLVLRTNNSTIATLDIRDFNFGASSGGGTGIVVDGSTGGFGDNNTIDDNYLTLNSNDTGLTGAIDLTGAADNNTFSNNTIEANFSDGIRFADSSNAGNQVSNNSLLNNGDDGARLSGDGLGFDNNTIRLSQQLSSSACGLELNAVSNSTISANLIENNGNQGGICLVDAASTDNTVGPFNTIRNHAGPGIYSDIPGSVRNRFTRNSLSDNAGLGIDLDRDGITPNDPDDTDTGTNDLLNFPEIYNVGISLGQVVVTGETRQGATVEFFVVAADPTGYGEGVNFLGSGVEGSGADSNGAMGLNDSSAYQFTFSLPIGVLTCGDTITATATDPAGSTSEFSLNFITPYCSLSFDGIDDIVRTVNLPAQPSFTVEAWVYRTADSGGQETFVSDADSGYIAADFSLYVDNDDTDCVGGPADEFAFRQRQPDDNLCSGVDATPNTWFHVAVSRTAGDTVSLFVDGAQVDSKVILDPVNSSGVFTFGRAGDFASQYFPGYIAEVRLASIALYTAPFTPPSAPLSAGAGIGGLWHMDEGSGQFALDSSGNLRHGILGSTPAAEANDPVWSSEHPY